MLLHDTIRGKIPTAGLDAIADYYEKLARDLRVSAAIAADREQEAAKGRAAIEAAFRATPLVERLVADGTPDVLAIEAIANALSLPSFQIAAIWHRYKIDRKRARRVERDAKIAQLVRLGWSNAAVARELGRLGYACHQSTVTRRWKTHVARIKIGPLAARLPSPLVTGEAD